MFLQTLGSLILVCGVSYHLVTASWQVVLLSFVVAGVGYATWKIRKSIIRRRKIKALWKRSIEIDEMLDTMERSQRAAMNQVVAPTTQPERRSGKTCVAFDGPAKRTTTELPKPIITDRDGEFLLATEIVPETPWRTARNQDIDPSTRVYKFSMKELASSREQKLTQQQVLV